MGVGILISSEHCTHSKVNLKLLPWVWEFFDTFFRPLYTLKGEFEVPWGWEFDIVLLVHTLNVNLKFHGGGNFDVFLITIAATQRSIWRSMGVEFFVSSYRSTNWRSNWSFMGVGILLSSDHCTLKGQFEVPWGWEIWYLLTGAHTQCQFEGPWGWEFLYLLAIVHTQRFIWSSTGWDFWYLLIKLYTFKVNLKFHGGGIWISSCPCTHSRSIWISWGSQGSACDHIGRVCGVAQPGDPRCTSGVAQYGELRIYNRVGTESQLDDIQWVRKGQGVQWMLNVGLGGSNL